MQGRCPGEGLERRRGNLDERGKEKVVSFHIYTLRSLLRFDGDDDV